MRSLYLFAVILLGKSVKEEKISKKILDKDLIYYIELASRLEKRVDFLERQIEWMQQNEKRITKL